MTDFADLSKWLSRPELQPENMLPLLILLAQGKFIIEDILPVVTTSSDYFQWVTETANDRFKVAQPAGERGLPTLNSYTDTTLNGTCIEYREMAQITGKSLRGKNVFSFINLVARNTFTIADKLRMNTERDAIVALQDTTTYTTINTYSGSAALTTTATADPYAYVERCKVEVEDKGGKPANILIIGTRDKSSLKQCDKARSALQYTENYQLNGMIVDMYNGLEVITSNAKYMDGGVQYNLLSGQAIITVKGEVGEIRESLPYTYLDDYDKKIDVYTQIAKRAFKPIIVRPTLNCLWLNVS